MQMAIYRTMIVVGQLGRIWAKSHTARKVYQTVTALGFYSLMTKTYQDREEWAEEQFTLNYKSTNSPKDLANDSNVRVKFKNFSKW